MAYRAVGSADYPDVAGSVAVFYAVGGKMRVSNRPGTVPNNSILVNTVGVLDAQGRGKAAFAWPKAFLPHLAGTVMDHALVTFGPRSVSFASNAVSLRMQ